MSFLDNARRALSTKSDDYYDEDRYEEDYEDYEDEEPKRPLFGFLGKRRNDEDFEEEYDEPAENTKPSAGRSYYSDRYKNSFAQKPVQPRTAMSGIEVTVHYPSSLDDATRIIREVKGNKITIFDISSIASDDEARRVVDYIGGAAYGMDCPFERLCPSIFCIAPIGVKIDTKRKY